MRNAIYTNDQTGTVKQGTAWYVFTQEGSTPVRKRSQRRALRDFQHAGQDAPAPRHLRPHLRAIRALQHTGEAA